MVDQVVELGKHPKKACDHERVHDSEQPTKNGSAKAACRRCDWSKRGRRDEGEKIHAVRCCFKTNRRPEKKKTPRHAQPFSRSGGIAKVVYDTDKVDTDEQCHYV